MRILIVKLSSIGDVVHTLPVLDSLKKGFPGARVDWIVEEEARGILEGHPLIGELHVVRKKGFISEPLRHLKVLSRIRSKRYDMVVDLQGLLKSAIWVALSKGRRKIGFKESREGASLFYGERLGPYGKEVHAVDKNLSLAKDIGGEAVVLRGGLHFPMVIDDDSIGAATLDSVNSLLAEHGAGPIGVPNGASINTSNRSSGGIGGGIASPAGGPSGYGDYFVISPGARWHTKLWSTTSFGEFARLGTERLGLRCLVVGGPGDLSMADEIVESSGLSGTGTRGGSGPEKGAGGGGEKIVNLAGKTSLRELSMILKHSRFTVTVDSGPMHIAAASGCSTLALFGPTSPRRTGPYGDNHIVLRRDLECSPCFKRVCPKSVQGECMEGITVEELLQGALSLNRQSSLGLVAPLRS